MNILITGATGFIGNHLISGLVARGHQVTAIARTLERAKCCGWYDAVRFIAQDIHSLTDNELDQLSRHDAVIHLAWSNLNAYKSLYHLENTLPKDYRFIKSLIMRGIKHVLITGTCFEYGMQNGCLPEELPPMPTTSYAIAKDSLRRFLEVLQREIPYSLQWARLFYLHGPGQAENCLLAQLERSIAKGDTIFNLSMGEQLRDYLPVEEVADRLAMLVERPKFGGIFNICSGKPISIRNLVEQQLALHNSTIKLNLGHYPYPEHEPLAFWGNSEKFHKICASISDG